MSRERTRCEARQISDQMACHQCGLVWDLNDTEPPVCPREQPQSPEQIIDQIKLDLTR